MRILKIYIVIALNFIFIRFGSALELLLPAQGLQRDVNIKTTKLSASEGDITKMIKIINEYLRFFVGFMGLLLLAYAGIKIITARGDKTKISSAYNLIIAAFIMIFVSILSYAIVRLLVNLF